MSVCIYRHNGTILMQTIAYKIVLNAGVYRCLIFGWIGSCEVRVLKD